LSLGAKLRMGLSVRRRGMTVPNGNNDAGKPFEQRQPFFRQTIYFRRNHFRQVSFSGTVTRTKKNSRGGLCTLTLRSVYTNNENSVARRRANRATKLEAILSDVAGDTNRHEAIDCVNTPEDFFSHPIQTPNTPINLPKNTTFLQN
jgi:hypothetical protein